MLKIGKEGEKRAREFLEQQGFKILKQNFHSRFGEIDIIATDDNIIHFIEVKTSKKYDALYQITPSKLAKLLKTINYYLYTHNTNKEYQLDAIIVRDEIEWIKNITY